MTYRIFLIEDDPSLAAAIQSLGERWGMEMQCARNFQNPLGELTQFDPHLVLMDVLLPFYNGYHWCSHLRQVSKVPVIFLSSASDNLNQVMAMNLGADDFIAKPFDGSVLIAKIQALLRRTYDFGPAVPVLEHRGALLNTGDGSLSVGEQKVELTKNEYRILFTLLQSKGVTVSREKLMDALWASDSFVDENTLTVNVNRLRRKLDSAGLSGFITTRVGEGYLVE